MSTETPAKKKANIAVIGIGWWTQGWHLPCLHRQDSKCKVVAIVDSTPHPKSNLNPDLESLKDIQKRYKVPHIFSSVEDMVISSIASELDGVLIATPHATHYSVASDLMKEIERRNKNGQESVKDLHIMMEKPMSTDIDHALSLQALVDETMSSSSSSPHDSEHAHDGHHFWINHSANYRKQTKLARDVVMSGKLGRIQHVSGNFASPLMWIFNDPSNAGWNVPTHNMLGNGFAWGQSSHLFAWIYHVCPTLIPVDVFCTMTHSSVTGADVSHSATIRCELTDDVSSNQVAKPKAGDAKHTAVMNISGTSLLPGNAHSDPPVPKTVSIQIFGTDGALIYEGNDRDTDSGCLEFRHPDGKVDVLVEDFHFENLDNDGLGPESLQQFVNLCYLSANAGGKHSDGAKIKRQASMDEDHEHYYYVGANVTVGLRSIQTIDAMYRSHISGKPEPVKHE